MTSRSFALAAGFLAFGSGVYHASLVPEWRLIDIMGVYAVLTTLLAHGIASVWPRDKRRLRELGIAAGGWLAAVWSAVHRNDFRWWGFKPLDSKTVVVTLVIAISLLALASLPRIPPAGRRQGWRLVAVITPLALLAFAGGQGDRFRGFWADPTSMVQGHSVWHATGALALFLVHELFELIAVGREQAQRLPRAVPVQ